MRFCLAHECSRGTMATTKGGLAMSADRKAFVVVHGIGDQEQRATLEAFLKCCNQGEQPASGATQLVRSPAVGSHLRPFSYFVQETSIGGKPAVVAEMYWSDLSRIDTGLLAPVRNFFNLMVAAPNIIYAGLGPKVSPDGAQHDYLSLRILRSLVALAFWTLFVVGAAYCLTFAILFLAFVLDLRVLHPGLELQEQINPLLVPILVIMAGFGGFLASKIERAVLRWSAVMTMGASIIALLGLIGWLQENTYKYYLDRINQLGMFLFLVPALIMYIFFALLPLLLLRFRQRSRGLLLAFAAMPMLLGFWVTFAITVGLWLVTTTYTENQSNQLFDETSKTFWHLGFDYLFLIRSY